MGPQVEAAREMIEGRGLAGLRLNLMRGGASSSPALVTRRKCEAHQQEGWQEGPACTAYKCDSITA